MITVFIYSMPGYSCSVKERMLYSSCKGPLLDIVESNLGLTISKKVTLLILKVANFFVFTLTPPSPPPQRIKADVNKF